jgi:hypothetical protein
MKHLNATRSLLAACLCVLVISVAASAATNATLSANPNPAFVGQFVTLTPSLPRGLLTPGGVLRIDFGDGSARVAAQWNVPVLHTFSQPGTYTAELLSIATGTPNGVVIARVNVTINARGGLPAMQVLGVSVSWPDGSQSLSLSGSATPPNPIALVRVSAPGTLVVQWRLDGNPVSTATQQATSPGNQRFVLQQALPNSGSHEVSLTLISPAVEVGAQPTPAPPVTYSYATVTPPQQVNHGFYTGPPPVVKFPPISFVFVEGKIDLKTPSWGINNGLGCHVEICRDDGTPMLDDSVLFTWAEENPGVADYFELRILSGSGAVLASKQFNAGTAYFSPDPAFLSDVLAKLRGQALQRARVLAFNSHAQGAVSDGSREPETVAITAARSLHSNALEYANANLLWEVRGYHRYALTQSQGKISKSQPDVEVEKSDQWPLGRPDDASGLGACPKSSGGIQYQNLALQTTGSNRGDSRMRFFDTAVSLLGGGGGGGGAVTNITNYIGDPIVIYGNLDLTGSPYLSKPSTVSDTQPNSLFNPIKEVDFDNLFVDWGDGTVEPLRAVPSQGSNELSYVQRRPRASHLSLPVAADPGKLDGQLHDSNNINVNMHRYTTTGSYTIRIYQLAEADVQHLTPAEIGAYVDKNAIAQNNPYLQYVHIQGMPLQAGSGGSHGSRFASVYNAQHASAADATGRAYLLFATK